MRVLFRRAGVIAAAALTVIPAALVLTATGAQAVKNPEGNARVYDLRVTLAPTSNPALCDPTVSFKISGMSNESGWGYMAGVSNGAVGGDHSFGPFPTSYTDNGNSVVIPLSTPGSFPGVPNDGSQWTYFAAVTLNGSFNAQTHEFATVTVTSQC